MLSPALTIANLAVRLAPTRRGAWLLLARAQLASGWAVDARAYHTRAYHPRANHTRANHTRVYHPRAYHPRAQHHPVRPVCAVRH